MIMLMMLVMTTTMQNPSPFVRLCKSDGSNAYVQRCHGEIKQRGRTGGRKGSRAADVADGYARVRRRPREHAAAPARAALEPDARPKARPPSFRVTARAWPLVWRAHSGHFRPQVWTWSLTGPSRSGRASSWTPRSWPSVPLSSSVAPYATALLS